MELNREYIIPDTIIPVLVFRKNNSNNNNIVGPKAEQVLNTGIRMHVVALLSIWLWVIYISINDEWR